MNLIRVLTLSSVMALGATAALAADLTYEPAPAPAPVVDKFNWTGFYAGVFGGVGGGQDFSQRLDYGFFNGPDDFSNQGTLGELSDRAFGFFGGLQAGYDYEFSSNVVLGAVTDFSFSNIDDKTNLDFTIPAGPDVTANVGSKVDWYGTIRGRLGYAFDKFLVYGTGGVAYGRVNTKINADIGGGPNFDYSQSDTKWGWTAGAGFEYALTKNVTIETEYLYVDLGTSTFLDPTYVTTIPNGGPDVGVTGKADTAFHTVRAALNYKF